MRAVTTNGIGPNLAPYLNPPFFAETERLRSMEGGSKPSFGGWPTPAPLPPTVPFTPAHNPTGVQGHVPIQTRLNEYTNHGLSSALNAGQWHDWDGTTTFPIWFPSTYTAEEAAQHRKDWYEFVFPMTSNSNYAIRGLKQLYEHYHPFLDENAPTIAEFENWNSIVLNHFRRLSGLDVAVPNEDLYIQVTLSEERKRTTYWDTLYPGTIDSAYGPCTGGTNIHCGATFVPDDYSLYFNSTPRSISTFSQSEVVLVDYNGSALMKMSRNLRVYFDRAKSGLAITGHSATFAFREKFGLGLTRSKWAGAVTLPPTGMTY